LFKNLTKLSENIEQLKQLYKSSKERFVTNNVRKKKFATNNANNKKIKICNANNKKIVTNNKRNKKKKKKFKFKKVDRNIKCEKKKFYENIYNLRRKLLLSHFFFQSFANFI